MRLSTQGETVRNEVLGSGDAGQAYQSFTLKQSALTYTPADTAGGGASTLEVRINEVIAERRLRTVARTMKGVYHRTKRAKLRPAAAA